MRLSRRPISRFLPRREVLKSLLNFVWVAPLAASLGQLLRFFRFEPPATEVTRFVLGTPAALPSLPAYLEDARVWLHRDTAGLYAIDAVCTHLGCSVHLQPDQTHHCPCHGSHFATDGSVLRGPAARPLPFKLLEVNAEGELIVDRTYDVDADYRLAEP